MTKENRAAEFIKRLGEDKEFRLDIGPDLFDIDEGDWAGMVKVAKEYGYTFTKTQLLGAVPDSFFKGSGKNPEAGWDESTRKARKTSKTAKVDKSKKSRKAKAAK